HDVLRAYRRIFMGVLKVAVVAAACLHYYAEASRALVGESSHALLTSGARSLVTFYLYPLYVYFNFSGYCDIVIPSAARFGIRMPENFNYPFLARNLIDYWTRFHITLGLWIRDYIFTPMYKTIALHWPSRAASLAFVCYFVAFLLAGIWHGSTWN